MTQLYNLPRSTPEAQGVSSAALAHLVDALNQIEYMNSLMLVRHGHVIAEGWWSPYAAQSPHMLFSLSKSFTSTAIGMLVDEGKLSVDNFVPSFFPDDASEHPDENLKAMRVRHLLSMSTGHDVDTLGPVRESRDDNWARAFLALPVVHEPGTHFVYNSGATYMLSAIAQRITGQRLLHFLTPRLFEPLGIEGATWEQCPRGIDVGGWGLSITTEDIAKFGQLYLQKGVWQGVQLVSQGWVDEATSAQVSNANNPTLKDADWQQGYGYQFWRCRHNAYRGDGAFGQFCVIMPDHDAVLAITSGVKNMQAVLDVVWEHLLPALSTAPSGANLAAHTALTGQLQSLSVPVPVGHNTSPAVAHISGRTYAVEDNPAQIQSIAFTFGTDACTITVRDARGEQDIACGYGRWHAGIALFDDRGPQPVAASSAWTRDDTFLIKVIFREMPFCETYEFRFMDNGATVDVDWRVNVSFGPTDIAHLKGKPI